MFWFKVTKFISVILIRLELNLTSNTLKSSFIHYILKFGQRSKQVNSRVFNATINNFHLFLILKIDIIDLPFEQTKTIRRVVNVFKGIQRTTSPCGSNEIYFIQMKSFQPPLPQYNRFFFFLISSHFVYLFHHIYRGQNCN